MNQTTWDTNANGEPSPFQACMGVLEFVARQMWQDGVDGKELRQPAYLWPMAQALQEYERVILSSSELNGHSHAT